MNVLIKSKKLLVMIGAAALLMLFAVRFAYLHLPGRVIALDINPSIELHTDILGNVVSVDPINEDASKLLAGYELKNKNLKKVVKDIVNRLYQNGYLTSPNTNEILISADTSNKSDQLVKKVNVAINDYLQEKQLDVKVLDQKLVINKENINAAHEHHISVGKMAIINKLLKINDNLTVEELAGASIKELMQYFADQGISVGEIVREYASNHNFAPSVTGTPADMKAADGTEAAEDADNITDNTEAGADITPAAEALGDGKDSDTKDRGKDIRAAKTVKVKPAKKTDAVSGASIKDTAGSKKRTLKHASAVKKYDINSENEDQNDDSQDIREKSDSDNEDDKYYEQNKDDSTIKDSDARENEDADFDEDSDSGYAIGSDGTDNHKVYGDSDNGDDDKDGSYQSHYEDNDRD